jgi:hypothetical protein
MAWPRKYACTSPLPGNIVVLHITMLQHAPFLHCCLRHVAQILGVVSAIFHIEMHSAVRISGFERRLQTLSRGLLRNFSA